MKKNLFKLTSIFSLTALFPVIAFAVSTVCDAQTTTLGNLLCRIQQLLNSIIPILVLLGVVYFVWGVVMFVIADSEEAKTKGKDKIIYGLIGFAVIVGMWGLVNVVVNSLGFSGSQLNAPTVENLGVQASGSACEMGKNFQGVLGYFTCIINDSVIPFLFALAIVMFIWGAVKFFIINSDEEAKREQGKQFMIWGIIALAIMLSVWGLVGILTSTFGVRGNVLPRVCPPGDPTCNK